MEKQKHIKFRFPDKNSAFQYECVLEKYVEWTLAYLTMTQIVILIHLYHQWFLYIH